MNIVGKHVGKADLTDFNGKYLVCDPFGIIVCVNDQITSWAAKIYQVKHRNGYVQLIRLS